MRTIVTTVIVTLLATGSTVAGLGYSGNLQSIQPLQRAVCDNKIDQSLKFQSDDDIKRHYGAIYRILLKDGRVFTGFVVLKKDKISIHLKNGIIEIGGDMWEAIKQVE